MQPCGRHLSYNINKITFRQTPLGSVITSKADSARLMRDGKAHYFLIKTAIIKPVHYRSKSSGTWIINKMGGGGCGAKVLTVLQPATRFILILQTNFLTEYNNAVRLGWKCMYMSEEDYLLLSKVWLMAITATFSFCSISIEKVMLYKGNENGQVFKSLFWH